MWMDEGRREHDWNLTCSIVATLINVNRGKGVPATSVEQIHPMRKAKESKLSPKQSVRAIAEAWGVKPPGDEQCQPLAT
jgi:hypothetical protein